MTTMELLTNKVAELTKARQRIDANRNYWLTVLKPLLITQLGQVKEAFPLSWSLAYGDSAWTNLDHVSLSFNNTDSGIVAIKTGQPVIKQGGGLFFGQFVNGKIVVLIVYPAIEDFAKASPPRQIGTFDPTDIDADFIARMVVQFLDEMTEWEEAGERSLPQIGFRL